MKTKQLVSSMLVILLACLPFTGVLDAQADIICQRKNIFPRPPNIFTRVQALRVIPSGACPPGFVRVGEFPSISQVKDLVSTTVAQMLQNISTVPGPQGPVGPQGPQGVPGPAGVVNANDPLLQVTYQYGPVRVLAQDSTRVIFFEGFARMTAANTWQTRIVARAGGIGEDPYPSVAGLNFPVVCDTGFVSITPNTSRNSLCASLVRDGEVAGGYFSFVGSSFPALRAETVAIPNSYSSWQISCGQATVERVTRDFQLASAGGCGFSSTFLTGVFRDGQFVAPGLPILANGESFAAEGATANKVCQLLGYTTAYSIGSVGYSSCSNNWLYRFNPNTGGFDRFNACVNGRRNNVLYCTRLS